MEEKIELKKLDWIVFNSDETMSVFDKKKNEYIFKEVNGTQYESIKNKATQLGLNIESLLAKESLISPKMNDIDYGELNASVTIRFQYAIMLLYGLNDFQ